MESTGEPLALGIIGAGIMGRRMMDAVQALAGRAPVRVAALWDPDPAALERIGAIHPGMPSVADAAAVVAASACVYVASPPASHLGHVRAALAAGRSVFCEKPLAVDLAEARAVVAEAGGAGAVNFPFASSPAVASLARWIGEGAVGTPRRLTIDVGFAAWPRPWQADAARWLDARAEGGFTREVVSHFLFLSRRMVGPLADPRGQVRFPDPGRSERSIDVTLRAGDIPVLLTGRVGATPRDDHNSWTLEGDAGTVRLRDWSIAERRGADGGFAAAPDAKPNAEARQIALQLQLDGVARMARGAPHVLATLSEALDVQEIVEGILSL
jgi:predicted dehydrogenase